MKKFLKQAISLVLAVMILCGLVPFGGVKEAEAVVGGPDPNFEWYWPLGKDRRPSAITSVFGDRSKIGLSNHKGIDLGRNTNADPVYAAADGVVEHVEDGWGGGLGSHIIIKHENVYEQGDEYYTVYAHLRKWSQTVGNKPAVKGLPVSRGDLIGTMGNTGNSGGIHLHFEIRKGRNSISSVINPTPKFFNGEEQDGSAFSTDNMWTKPSQWWVRYNTELCTHEKLNSVGDCTKCGNYHDHKYDEKGFCKKESCKFDYLNKAERTPYHASINLGWLDKIFNKLKPQVRPYGASEFTGVKLNKAEITAKIKNHYDNIWYELTVDGNICYVYSEDVDEDAISALPSIIEFGKDITTPPQAAIAGDAVKTQVKGTITSSDNLTTVKAVILDRNTSQEYYKAERTQINAMTFDLSVFNDNLLFKRLPGGKNYRYLIVAENTAKICKSFQYDFQVLEPKTEIYTISFDANGGFGAPPMQNVGAGNSIDLSTLPKPTMSGCNFIGWTHDRYSETVEFGPSATVKPTSSMTLYAVWQMIDPPAVPTMTATTVDVGEGRTVNIAWNPVDTADTYIATAYDGAGNAVQSTTTSAPLTTLLFDAEGTYTVRVKAANIAGESEDSETAVTVIVHGPSTVTFKNYDGSIWSEQSVPYGASAVEPAEPTRIGYRFGGWEGDYGNVTEDRELSARFTAIGYTVVFYDAMGDAVKTETVYYNGDTPGRATPPAVSALKIPENYAFVGWDTNAWESVTQNGIKVYPAYIWANENVPIEIKIDSVEAAGDDETDGYWVNYTITNHAAAAKTGRVVIVLKSNFGKFLTQTESGAFYLAGGDGTTYKGNLYVPFAAALSSEVFATVEAYVVGSYSSLKPIAEPDTYSVLPDGGDWSAWMTREELAASGLEYTEVETKQQYRTSDMFTVETTASKFLNWELLETVTRKSDWSAWSDWQDEAVTAGDDVEVKTQEVVDVPLHTEFYYGRYISYDCAGAPRIHWCRPMAVAQYGGTWEPQYTQGFMTDYEWTGNAVFANKKDTLMSGFWDEPNKRWWYPIFDLPFADNADPSLAYGTNYFWRGWRDAPATYKTQYSYRTRTDIVYNIFYTWDEWSEWMDGTKAASETQQVETREIVRVKLKAPSSAAMYTLSGSVGAAEASGKQAILTVYKVDEASDYSNQYMEQVTLGENGAYNFSFNTLETPSMRTGDFTATLTIEGSDTPLYIGTIEAPKPEYSVTFVNEDGSQIGEKQTVLHGGSVTAPIVGTDWTVPEGKLFVGWEYGLTNIRDNMVIHARYAPKTYAVVYVDWANHTVAMQSDVAHGAALELPEVKAPEGHYFIGWKAPEGLDVNCVTDNMIVVAAYDKMKYTVIYYDANGNVLSEQTVEHGELPEDPAETEGALEVPSGMYFDGWGEGAYQGIVQPQEFRPVLRYEQSAAPAVPSVAPGIYEGTQTVTLTCEDADAAISYFLTGTDENDKEVTDYRGEPITIDASSVLEVMTVVSGKNTSSVTLSYEIVPEGTRPAAPAAIQAEADEEKITLTWDAVDGATGYALYKTNRFGGTQRFLLEKNSYVDTELESRESYTYTVNAYRIYASEGNEIFLESAAGTDAEVMFYGNRPNIASIDVSAPSTMYVGDSAQLAAAIAPFNAYDASVAWSVENGTGEASVSENGVLTAKSVGTVTVVATANDGGGASGSAEVTIGTVATEAIELSVSSATLHAGSTATVSVELEAGSNATVIQFALLYDAEKLELKSTAAGDVMNALSPTINDTNAGVVYFVWDSLTELTEGGSLLDITFALRGEVTSEDVLLTIPTASDEYEFLFYAGDDPIHVVTRSGKLTLIDVPYGDVNFDGRINAMDANIVRRYAAKLYTLEGAALAAADVDGSGSVNAMDANLIRRYAVKLIDEFPVVKGS